MKVALVGAGYIAREAHMRVLSESPGSELSLIVDPSENALADAAKRFPKSKCVKSLEEADLKGIDCAIIASPSVFHFPQAKYLLEQGIHVLCEKPLALKHSEAKELEELSQKKKRVLLVGYNRRFQPVTQHILEALKTDKYGRLNKVTIRAGWIAKDLPPGILNRAVSGGGILMDYAVHYMDRLCSWFQNMEVVSFRDDSRGGIESNAVAEFRGSTLSCPNVPITMLLSWTNEMGDTICLDFENISVACTINNPIELSLSTRNRNTNQLKKIVDSNIIQTGENPVDTMMLQWKEFQSRIKGEPEKHSSLADAVRTATLAEQCYLKRKSLELAWGL